MAQNDIIVAKEGVGGVLAEIALAPADIAAAPASHTHAAADITSGTLNIGRIPTGTGSTQVALGNHTHTLSAITDAGTAAAQDANQDLGTSDQVTFQGVTVNGPPVNEIYPGEGVVNCGKLNLDTYAVDLGGGSTGDGFPSIVFGALNGGITLKGPEGDITTSKVINIPNASGTIALTSDFAAPPAIGSTTPAAISGTTGTFTTLTATPSSGSALTLTGGTVTASAPLISATQTWNDAAVTFTGLAATITNTASATASLVARLTVGSTNVLETDARGFTTLRKVATTTDFVNVFTVRRGTTQIFAVRDDGAVNANSYSTNAGGGGASFISDDGFAVRSSGSFRISSNTAAFTADVYLRRDAAGVFAQYNGTNAQEYRVYGTYTSGTNYQRLAIKTKAVTLSALSGASVATTTGLIPDGAVLVGLTTRVSTAITGATGYDIGDGTDADRWGANIGIALNTSSDNRDWTAGTIECFTAAQEVTLTAVGSNFTGGAVVIVAHYLAGEAD